MQRKSLALLLALSLIVLSFPEISAGADSVPPSVTEMTVNGLDMQIQLNEPIDDSKRPGLLSFAVKADGRFIGWPADIEINENTATLDLVFPVRAGQEVSLTYIPGVNPLKDVSGNQLAPFIDLPVANNTVDVEPPELKEARVNGRNLQLEYNEPLDGTIKPTVLAYPYKVNGKGPYFAKKVRIDGSTVIITLSQDIQKGDSVSISFKPLILPLRDIAGNKAPAFSGQAVTNLTGVDQTPPSLVSAQVNKDALQLIFDENLDAASIPDGSDFTVNADNNPLGHPIGVILNNEQVMLTLPDAVTAGQTVILDYYPGSHPLKDGAGNTVAAIASHNVTNSTVGGELPLLLQSRVNGQDLELVYNKSLSTASVPLGTDFMISVDNANQAAPAAISILDSTVKIRLAAAVAAGQAVTIDYTPGSNPIKDAEGNKAPALVNQAVDNQTAALPGIEAPLLDPTIPSNTYDATAFLYSGENPVQTGMSPDAIEKNRAAVIRGRAITSAGEALSGVAVKVAGHPEYGQTVSRIDGWWDMAVNGGGVLTVEYSKTGYIPVQRSESIPWQDYMVLDDVALIPYDAIPNPITFGSDSSTQTAQGSPVLDGEGIRQSTVIFPAGTSAELVMPDGSRQAINSGTVRCTEFTVGVNGPLAMPGPLPADVGYTYCAEISIDEANAAGAASIEFNQPVINYVNNFLNFPTGTAVPVGWYDRGKQCWIPSDNGCVIKILAIDSGRAVLDLTGSGTAASADELAAMNITDSELEKLAELYQAGGSLWRVQMEHFSPWDYNWPYGPPASAVPPENHPVVRTKIAKPTYGWNGSLIEYENQVLGQVIDLAGAGILCYKSSSQAGYATQNIVTVFGDTVPEDVTRAIVNVYIAGIKYKQEFAPEPNQKWAFIWDGQDAYGRQVNTIQTAMVEVGYAYKGVYQSPAENLRSFNLLSGIPITGDDSRQEMILWRQYSVPMSPESATPVAAMQALGGWTLPMCHSYDIEENVLYMGNGNVRDGETVLRPGLTVLADGPYDNSPNSGGLSSGGVTPSGFNLSRILDWITIPSLAVDPSGNIYKSLKNAHQVQKVSPDGTVSVVAGTGTPGFTGDGGSAASACLNAPSGLALDKDGNLYIADSGNYRIRKISPSGIISTVAGTTSGFDPGGGFPIGADIGDGGPATEALLNYPVGIAVDNNGSLYICEMKGHRLRQVTVDGRITTIAGNGSDQSSGDGAAASQAGLPCPTSVSVSDDGSLSVTQMPDSSYDVTIRRIEPDGKISTESQFNIYSEMTALNDQSSVMYPSFDPAAVSIDTSQQAGRDLAGNFYYNTCITRLINLLGNEFKQNNALIPKDPSGGSIFSIADGIIMKIDRSGCWINDDEYAIPADDGAQIYIFDSQGRHLRTVNALTGAVLTSFTYDAYGHLLTVSDANGNQIAIERDASGVATAISSPAGQRTVLTIDGSQHLVAVADPSGLNESMAYDEKGLLTGFTDKNGNTDAFIYDSTGRLTGSQSNTGVTLNTGINLNGWQVDAASALGRQTSFEVKKQPNGDVQYTQTMEQLGNLFTSVESRDGFITSSSPDGSSVVTVLHPDPRWGMQSPYVSAQRTTLPSGMNSTLNKDIKTELANPSEPLSMVTQTENVFYNWRNYSSVYTASARSIASTTPTGLQTGTECDEQGRVIRVQVPGQEPVTYAYNSRGQVSQVAQGGLTKSFEYDQYMRLATETDAAGREVHYTYDSSNRLTGVSLPEGREYTFAYDGNGNVTAMTMPNGATHSFAYDSGDRISGYTPTGSAPYSMTYNEDGQLSSQSLPGGQVQSIAYDDAGRLSSLDYDAATVNVSYNASTKQIESVSRNAKDGSQNQTLSYSYDGPLLAGVSLNGCLDGQYSYSYNNSFNLTGINIDGRNILEYEYNDDGQMTRCGPFNVTRSTATGAPDVLSDGSLRTQMTYDNLGRLLKRESSINGASVYSVTVSYNQAGLVATETETGASGTNEYAYTYNSNNELGSVIKNGQEVENYSYDVNGNRIGSTVDGLTSSASYDTQDRMNRYGNTDYVFDADGFLTQRGQDLFDYSGIVELRSASLATGKIIQYESDAAGRRLSRDDGAAVEQYLYANPAHPFQLTMNRDNNGGECIYYYDNYGFLAAVDINGIRYYVLTDETGSPRVFTDSAGNIVKELEYDSWGNIRSDSNPGLKIALGFAGGLQDQDTGLIRFGLRDYDPVSGRWTSKDPVGFQGGQANLYVYCGNNPVAFFDRNGLMPDFHEYIDSLTEATPYSNYQPDIDWFDQPEVQANMAEWEYYHPDNGYCDINLTAGSVLGLTTGFQADANDNVHYYIGPALTTTGMGVSVQFSNDASASSGVYMGLQGTVLVSEQTGVQLDNYLIPVYTEEGFGTTPGLSISVFYVTDPLFKYHNIH